MTGEATVNLHINELLRFVHSQHGKCSAFSYVDNLIYAYHVLQLSVTIDPDVHVIRFSSVHICLVEW